MPWISSKYIDKIISWIEIIVIYIIHFKNFTRELLPRVLVSLFAANASESCLAGRGTRGRRCLRLGRGSPESWPCHINMNPNFTTFLRISCNICSDLHGVTVSSSIIASCSAVCSADKCTFSVEECVDVLFILVTTFVPEKYAISPRWRAAWSSPIFALWMLWVAGLTFSLRKILVPKILAEFSKQEVLCS